MSFLADGVRVTGLDEFQKGLNKLEDDTPSMAQNIGLISAKKTIIFATPTVPVVTGATVRSLIAVATSSGGIAEGGSGLAHYGWLDLGGRSGRRLANRRTYISKGRYIVPAYEDNEEKIKDGMEEELNRVVRLSGLDVDNS